MKKLVKSFAILAVVVIALGATSAVFAQDETPVTPYGFGGAGIGSRGKGGGRGVGNTLLYQNRDSYEDGLLHDLMITAFADALGMDVATVESQIAAGETLADIAFDEGLTVEEFRTLLAEIRTQVHDEAVEQGLLPGSQSGWANNRRPGNAGYGARRGAGQGLFGTGNCPYDDTIE